MACFFFHEYVFLLHAFSTMCYYVFLLKRIHYEFYNNLPGSYFAFVRSCLMTSGQKEKSSNSKVKREITKQDHSKPGHLKKIKVGPGAKEE